MNIDAFDIIAVMTLSIRREFFLCKNFIFSEKDPLFDVC